MMWREICDLLTEVETPDGIGGFVTSYTSRTVFADRKSIRQSEFYQAHAVGLKPEITLVVRMVDYDNESRLRWNEQVYDILRTHSKNGEIIELVCAKRAEVV